MKSNIFLSIFIISVLICCKTTQEKDLRASKKESIVAKAKTQVDGENLIIERTSISIEKMEYLSSGHVVKLNNLKFSMPREASYVEMYIQPLTAAKPRSDTKIIQTTSYILNNVTPGPNNIVLRACVDVANATNPSENCGPTVAIQLMQEELDDYAKKLDERMHAYTKASSAIHKDSEETISAAEDFIKEAQQCKDESVTKFLETAQNMVTLGGSNLAQLWVEAKGDDKDSFFDPNLVSALGGISKTVYQTTKGSGGETSTEEEVFSRLIISSGGLAAVGMTYSAKEQVVLKKLYGNLKKEIEGLAPKGAHGTDHIIKDGRADGAFEDSAEKIKALKNSALAELKSLRYITDNQELKAFTGVKLNKDNFQIKRIIDQHRKLNTINKGSFAAKGLAALSIITFASMEGGNSINALGAIALTDITCARDDKICLVSKEACDKAKATLQVLEAKELKARALSKQLEVIGKDIKGTTGDDYYDFLDEAAVDPTTPIPDTSPDPVH